MANTHDTLKNTMDVVSVFAAIGSFLQMLTPVFGLIGAVWTLMRIAEMISGKPFADLIRRKKADAEQK
jgi:hypothetical protein